MKILVSGAANGFVTEQNVGDNRKGEKAAECCALPLLLWEKMAKKSCFPLHIFGEFCS